MDQDGRRAPLWARKSAEGKMFQRLECGRCRVRFLFGDNPRATRIPRCPGCGGDEVHARAA